MRDEYLEFLEKYLDCFYGKSDKRAFVARRLAEFDTLKIDDIVKRPVQARMLAQILLNPKNSVKELSRYDLYNMFVEDCLTREEEKPERRKTDRETRRRFMQELAWWVWGIKRTRTFTFRDIPNDLIQKFILQDQDPEAKLRELLVGSLVEEQAVGSLVTEKDAGTFYFPHLSFTEFLVAGYLIESDLVDGDIACLAGSFEGEIKSFIGGYKKRDGRFKLYNDLRNYRGSLPWVLVQFLAESKTLKSSVKKLIKNDAYSICHFAVEFCTIVQAGRANEIVSRCANLIGADEFRTTVIAIQLLLSVILDQEPNQQELAADLLLRSIFREMHFDTLAGSVRRQPFTGVKIRNNTERVLVRLLTLVELTEAGAFSFDAARMYSITIKEDGAITDDQKYEPKFMGVKVSFIRRSLRTKHDQEQFDRILTVLGSGPIFELDWSGDVKHEVRMGGKLSVRRRRPEETDAASKP